VRLARVLLLLANLGMDGRQVPVVGEIKQDTLAEIVGTTRSQMTLLMNKFHDLGFIDYNGKLEIHSSLLSLVSKYPQSRQIIDVTGSATGKRLEGLQWK
jgi:CRP/FNR family transcriptional regulator, cyclic AMP receptor protein